MQPILPIILYCPYVPICVDSSRHTQLLEFISYVGPGVFGDEGLDQAPWLLLVFHIGVDPGSTAHILDGSRLKSCIR